jgi:protocatechuate 3,4-dioxygenase beta subunit
VNDDVKNSRLRVSRRRALSLGGTIGLGGLLAACSDESPSAATPSTTSAAPSAAPSAATATASATKAPGADLIAMLDKANTCSTSREGTQGPYWFDVDSIRTDIREDRPGAALQLALRVQDLSKCAAGGEVTPVSNCVVEIWHCDAGGVYSGFEEASTGGGGGGSGASDETSDGSYSVGDSEATTGDDGTYLRGAQVADSNGIVQFVTIYPGWYRGRTMHIHVKVHIDKKTVLTTQLYADDDFTDKVYRASPYDEHGGRDTLNTNDSIYDKSGLMVMKTLDDGYLGVVNIGIDV